MTILSESKKENVSGRMFGFFSLTPCMKDLRAGLKTIY
ncbi:hypothetical protein LEP1GSC166_1176 [Leptospira kirschneri]|nr:hypothetical protein LEP1GSC166_1176 [Leptospira kirschneri]